MSRTYRRPVLATSVIGGVVALGAAARGIAARRTALQAVAPDLRHPGLLLPMPVGSTAALRLMRRMPARPAPLVPGVTVERRLVTSAGHPDVSVYVYDSGDWQRPTGALVWIHGGGFVIGNP